MSLYPYLNLRRARFSTTPIFVEIGCLNRIHFIDIDANWIIVLAVAAWLKHFSLFQCIQPQMRKKAMTA